MQYEFHEQGTILMQQNDVSNEKFYMVLSGSIGIMVNALNLYDKEPPTLKSTLKKPLLTQSKLRHPSQSFIKFLGDVSITEGEEEGVEHSARSSVKILGKNQLSLKLEEIL